MTHDRADRCIAALTPAVAAVAGDRGGHHAEAHAAATAALNAIYREACDDPDPDALADLLTSLAVRAATAEVLGPPPAQGAAARRRPALQLVPPT